MNRIVRPDPDRILIPAKIPAAMLVNMGDDKPEQIESDAGNVSAEPAAQGDPHTLYDEYKSAAASDLSPIEETGAASDVHAAPALNFSSALAVEDVLSQPGCPLLSFDQLDADGKKVKFSSQAFPDRDPTKIFNYIEKRQGKGGLYVNVNPIIKPENKKAERENIASVTRFHIDLDPRVDEPQEKAIPRLLAALDKYKLKPSKVVVSGGGVQGYWNLKEPIEIGGDLVKAEDAKLYNVQLERDLGGDNCHNIDRIMRIVGTVNVPNERKRRKGRKAAVAYLEYDDPTIVYDLSEFVKAKPLVAPGSSHDEPAQGKTKAGPVATTPRVENVNDDPRTAGLKDWVKQCIVTGNADGKQYASRSEMVFAIACEFKRAGQPDELFKTIFTDREWPCSASILDKKNVEREISRVLDRAKLHTFDRDLYA